MTSKDTRMEKIRARLYATFSPHYCLLLDDSAAHAGHAGASSGGGHYKLTLISDLFEDKTRIARHRLVYDCLLDMMHKDIHAIAITALALSESPR